MSQITARIPDELVTSLDAAAARLRRSVDRLRIIEAIDGLASNPLSGSVLKGEFEGLRRLRVGHRREIYR